MNDCSDTLELNLPQEIARAARRIAPHILETPLFHSAYLSEMCDGEVYLKLESEQYTGSFKARGALNKVLSLPAEARAAGLLTASSGNHAQGFARALAISGDRGLIYLPENAEASKVAALRHYGVELAFHGTDCLQTELHARAQADQAGDHQVAVARVVVVFAALGDAGRLVLFAFPRVLGYQHGATQPIAGSRVDVLVDPGHDGSVGLLATVTARVNAQRVEVVLLGDRVLWVVADRVCHGGQRDGGGHGPAGPVPLAGVALVG